MCTSIIDSWGKFSKDSELCYHYYQKKKKKNHKEVLTFTPTWEITMFMRILTA